VTRLVWTALLLTLTVPALAIAQTAPPATEPKLSLSGYVQPQFEVLSERGETTDHAFFRRMVLSVEAVLTKAWTAEVQIDVGPVASGDDRLTVKNAQLQYTGWENRGILFTVGNQKMPFSRSVLASSSERGLIERPFTGDRGFGSPGRALSVKIDGWHRRQTLYWSAALASSRQSPDPDEIRVDGITEAEPGWNQGPLAAGRIELHPFGPVPRGQGSFDRRALRFTVGAGAYGWWNDDDEERHGVASVDAGRVAGFEMSGGLRGRGLFVDAEFEHVVSHAIEPITAGLYTGGRAEVDKASIEAGYMVIRRGVEALVGIDAVRAPAFDAAWRRASAGMNWYVNGHRLKFSLTHRESFNHGGARDARSRTTYLQAHFAF
jgi:hypothetical protein